MLTGDFVVIAIGKVAARQVIETVYRENSIERPQRIAGNSKLMPLTSMSRLSRRENNESRNSQSTSKLKKKLFPKISQNPSSR